MFHWRSLLLLSPIAGLALALPACPAAGAADTIALVPGSFTLDGPAARQRIVVERQRDAQNVGAVTEGVQFTIDDPAVLKIADGLAIPLADGRTRLTATVDGQTASAQIEVVHFDRPAAWSFRNHVEPVLSHAGCNSVLAMGPWPARKVFGSACAASIPRPIISTSPGKPDRGGSCSKIPAGACC